MWIPDERDIQKHIAPPDADLVELVRFIRPRMWKMDSNQVVLKLSAEFPDFPHETYLRAMRYAVLEHRIFYALLNDAPVSPPVSYVVRLVKDA